MMQFFVYAGLGWMWTWTLEGFVSKWFRLAIAFVLAVGFGATLERHQTLVPGRIGTLLDVVLNAVGVTAGLIATALLF